MKILVVQLLRLGDILMSAPIIHGLQKKYPKSEVHVLAFSRFKGAAEVLNKKIHWHWIDRENLQKSLADEDRPFFEASDELAECLASVRRHEFDRVINLTQTIMSGWISSLFGVEDVVGLHYTGQGLPRFGSPWFQYLNDYMAAGKGEVFHYVDLFRYACELDQQPLEWVFQRAPMQFRIASPFILAQVTTSDEKKTYPISLWKKAFSIFHRANKDYSIGVLTSPTEFEPLKQSFSDQTFVHVVPCSLSEALSLMDQSELIVTGDTSIKHLACGSQVPVIELSLGSSDPRKTGIYKPGSLILQSRVSCSPCAHASPCSQKVHECALSIEPEAIAVAMSMKLNKNINPTSALQLFSHEASWFETLMSPTGFWMMRTLGEENRLGLYRLIEKSTWKFLLQRELSNPLARFGSESLQIHRTLKEHFSLRDLSEDLDFLESEVRTVDQNIGQLLKTMEYWLEKPLDDARRLHYVETFRDICEKTSSLGFAMNGSLGQAGEANTNIASIERIRRLQIQLDDVFKRTQIKLKLIRSLKNQVLEN